MSSEVPLLSRVEKIVSDRTITAGEIVVKLKELPIDPGDPCWISILGMIADRGPLQFFEFIESKLFDVARPDPRFYELLEKLEREGDGMLSVSMIDIGTRHPEAKSIFDGIKDNPKLFSAKGFLYGGICAKNPDESIGTIRKSLESSDESQRIFASQALKIAGEALSGNLNALIVLDQAQTDPNPIVRSNVLLCYLKMYGRDKKILDRIIHLIRIDPRLRPQAIMLSYATKVDPEALFRIVKTCMTNDGYIPATEIAHLLSFDVLPIQDALGILRTILTKFKTARGVDLDYAIEMLASKHQNECFDFISEWSSQEKDQTAIRHVLPTLLYRTLVGNKERLLQVMIEWVDRGEPFREISLEAMREMLAKTKDDDPLVRPILLRLVDVAKKEGKEPLKATRNEPRARIQCLILISLIERRTPSLNYQLMEDNLRHYPNIAKFVQHDWLSNMEKIDNTTHPLLRWLNQPPPDKQELDEAMEKCQEGSLSLLERAGYEMYILRWTSPTVYLTMLNSSLSRIDINERGARALAKGLQSEEEFDSTFSETEVVALLRAEFNVEIHPDVGKSQKEGEHPPKLDLRISNSSTIFVEVITPGTISELLHSGQVVSVKNRSKGMLISEVEKHLKNLPSEWSYPFLIIIDRSHSEIDEYHVENSIFGTEGVAFEIPTGDHEPRAWSVRADDAVTKNPQMSLLSGVLTYAMRHSVHGVPFYDVHPILNPQARHPLTKGMIDTILKCFPTSH